jgi:cysteine-rich repeat protein
MRLSLSCLPYLFAVTAYVACGTAPQSDEGVADASVDATADGSGGDVVADAGVDDTRGPDAEADTGGDTDPPQDTVQPSDVTDAVDNDSADADDDAPDFSECGELECDLAVPSCNGSLLFNCEVLADGCPGLVLVEDCGSDDLVCTAVEGVSTCAAEPTCDDGVFNGTETDLDCGGECDPCRDGRQCEGPDDCISNSCVAGICTAPSCTDGQVNGIETDVDCGGAACGPCADDSSCAEAIDCVSGVCEAGFCSPANCSDAVSNGNETGIDCGGDCPGCPAESPCLDADDCLSRQCNDGLCREPSCEDGIRNQDESDTDCGGTSCAACPTGAVCSVARDCASSLCAAGICVAAACGDGVVNSSAEECDGGGETLTCDANCTARACGDGIVNATAGETCDTGGPSATCDSDCTAATCGDGFVNLLAGEECDDRGESIACNANCTPARCGDSVVNTVRGEACDTGSASVSCDADCTAPLCGDGVVNAARGEACDAGRESATCDNDCTTAACGDRVVNATAGETCDAGTPTDECTAVCQAPRCGDGIVQAGRGEQCDTGGASATCTAACRTQTLCGNGVVNPGEACDTSAESRTCNADCSAVRCGDNIVNFTAGETCDNATLPTATCDTDCTTAFCGDGQVNAAASELCDDANAFFGDCCSATCRPQICETEANNLTTNANSLAVNTTVFGRITASEVDLFRITVPANTGLRIVTGGATIDACTNATDTVIRLLNSASGELARDDDDADTGLCSLISPDRDTGAYNLAAGTYYIEVKGFNSTVAYDYSLRWSVAQSCGNALIEPGESCDGGADCGTNCRRIAVCGNGFIDTGESCDDANTGSWDGCSATCAVENVQDESEGFNDSTLFAGLLSPFSLASSVLVAGSLSTTTDRDYLPITIPTEGVYRFEAAHELNGSCASNSTFSGPTLSVRSTSDVALVSSTSGGPDRCPGLTVWLPAGSFYLRYGTASDTGTLTAAVPFYRISMERIQVRGAESEPNDSIITADPVTIPGFLTGFRTGADIDYYRIELSRISSLYAEVIEGDAGYGCSASTIDSRIFIYNAAGTEIDVDDDGGRGLCSALNGVGTTQVEAPALSALSPGVYYLAVRESSFVEITDPLATFNYRLVVFTRSPY